jgi:acetolactate synthase I/III small subunit
MKTTPMITLELQVRNHAGVLMHVVSLFARRAFNLEGVACMPEKNPVFSRIWLRVFDDDKLGQIIAQLEKLEDVLSVERHPPTHETFRMLESFMSS